MKPSVMKQESTLKRILRYVGKYPLSLCGSIFFAMITVAATLRSMLMDDLFVVLLMKMGGLILKKTITPIRF